MSILNVKESKLKGVLVIEPPTIFKDLRGTYIETYNEKIYKVSGIRLIYSFIQNKIDTDLLVTTEGQYQFDKLNEIFSFDSVRKQIENMRY